MRETRVVVAPPARVVGIGIDIGDGDDVRSGWMCVWVGCCIVISSIVLLWLAKLTVRFDFVSTAVTFIFAVSYGGVDVSVCDFDWLRGLQWIVLVEEIRGKIRELRIKPAFLRCLGPYVTKGELESIYQKI